LNLGPPTLQSIAQTIELLSHFEKEFLNYILICLSNQSFRVESRRKEESFAVSVKDMASSVLILNP
jgi:hypothetical protein